jgi:hypothetical protein
LEDKSMVLILESKSFSASKWTQFEVAFAKRRRLGVCSIALPGVVIPSHQDVIEPERRLRLTAQDFAPSDPDPNDHSLLSEASLDAVIKHVKFQHNVAYVRRKQMLVRDLNLALKWQGLNPCVWDGVGAYTWTGVGRTARICISPRPAELADFYNGAEREPKPSSSGEALVLISPHLKMGAVRQRRLDWVNGLAKARHFDPIRIPILVHMMKTGSL